MAKKKKPETEITELKVKALTDIMPDGTNITNRNSVDSLLKGNLGMFHIKEVDERQTIKPFEMHKVARIYLDPFSDEFDENFQSNLKMEDHELPFIHIDEALRHLERNNLVTPRKKSKKDKEDISEETE